MGLTGTALATFLMGGESSRSSKYGATTLSPSLVPDPNPRPKPMTRPSSPLVAATTSPRRERLRTYEWHDYGDEDEVDDDDSEEMEELVDSKHTSSSPGSICTFGVFDECPDIVSITSSSPILDSHTKLRARPYRLPPLPPLPRRPLHALLGASSIREASQQLPLPTAHPRAAGRSRGVDCILLPPRPVFPHHIVLLGIPAMALYDATCLTRGDAQVGCVGVAWSDVG